MGGDYGTWDDAMMDAFASAIIGRIRSEATAGIPVNLERPVLAAAELASAGGGRLHGFHVYNSKAIAQYIMIFDATSQPANGTVTPLVWPIGGSSALDVEYRPPRVFQRGIWICNSTTDTSLTLGSADCLFDVQYQ